MQGNKHIANRTDDDLRAEVEAALRTALPDLATHVGVGVGHGTVTLLGELPTPDVRRLAVRVATEVDGVRAVADELTLPGANHSPAADTVIAVAAARALDRAEDVPEDSITIEVADRIVVLTGTVTSAQERLAAERALAYVNDVARIDNLIGISQLP